MQVSPGALFVATLKPPERSFLQTLTAGAKANGYKRFVEPCAGAFAMAQLAVTVGWEPRAIEASDITLFSALMACGVMGRDTSELGLEADGFEDEDLSDPAVALWALQTIRLERQAGKHYYQNLVDDMYRQKERHIDTIRASLERGHELLGGMSYRSLDMWEHLEEVLDDPEALVIINPPTYTGGFEKWYDTGGRMRWNEPSYSLFDPEEDVDRLMREVAADAKALVVCYEEREPGNPAGEAIFARFASRRGINVYLTANRADEALKYTRQRSIARATGLRPQPLDCKIVPHDFDPTEGTQVTVRRLNASNALYYRLLWTHRFLGSQASHNIGVFFDDMIMGVLGYDTNALTMGRYGADDSSDLILMYAMATPSHKWRLFRLLNMLSVTKDVTYPCLTDYLQHKVKAVKSIMLTPYPESKANRGIYRLEERKRDPEHGFRLVYTAPLSDETVEEVFQRWLRREQKRHEMQATSLAKNS